jgi:hypothetical protein
VFGVIFLRVFLFLAVFFALRWAAHRLELRGGLPLGLGLLAASSFVAFFLTALVVGGGLRSALLAWVAIYLVIAGLWVLRRWSEPGGSIR